MQVWREHLVRVVAYAAPLHERELLISVAERQSRVCDLTRQYGEAEFRLVVVHLYGLVCARARVYVCVCVRERSASSTGRLCYTQHARVFAMCSRFDNRYR